jgi:hypothetical protein
MLRLRPGNGQEIGISELWLHLCASEWTDEFVKKRQKCNKTIFLNYHYVHKFFSADKSRQYYYCAASVMFEKVHIENIAQHAKIRPILPPPWLPYTALCGLMVSIHSPSMYQNDTFVLRTVLGMHFLSFISVLFIREKCFGWKARAD